MNPRIVILLLLVLVGKLTAAQFDYYRYDSIPIIYNGDTLDLAWSGGFNNPQFSEIDLNNDSILDLFVFEKDGNLFKTFINTGDSGKSGYYYTEDYQFSFPELKNMCLLRDYNCDGKHDLFTGTAGGLRVYKNVSSALLGVKFELETTLLMSDYGPSGMLNLYVAATDIPAIDDIDNDGDLDILTFSTAGSKVEYHENLSMDLYGNCDSLTYKLSTSCWGSFAENASNNNVTLGISCRTGFTQLDTTPTSSVLRHSGSTLLTIDLDKDGDKELILGDVSFNNMVMLTNGGSATSADMIAQDTAFPSYSTPVDLSLFPAGFYLDINNDSIKDLIVTPTAKNAARNFNNVWLYTNTSATDSPLFNYSRPNFMGNEMIEVGSGANPVFVDVNGDGLQDIIIGNYGYYNTSGIFEGKLMYLKNTGTSNNPIFSYVTDNFELISTLGETGLYPAFGDLDSDGDLDMVLGTSNGILEYYENKAGPGNTINFAPVVTKFMNIDVGYFSTPFIIDYNHDGLNDLLIGERAGTIKYFENKGTTSSAFFKDVPDIDTVGNIDVMPICCTGYSTVHMTFDSSNIGTLWIGTESGIIYKYVSTDSTLANYVKTDSVITSGNRVNASLADINNDGRAELLFGQYSGGIGMYSKTSNLRLLSPINNATNVNDTIMLDWSSVQQGDYYQLQLDSSITFNSPTALDTLIPYLNQNADNIDTEFLLEGLAFSSTYYWRVRVIAGNDSSSWTNVWSFTVEDSTIIDFIDTPTKTYFHIYPNPTNQHFTVKCTSCTEITKHTIEMYSIEGKKVLRQTMTSSTETVYTDQLMPGSYVLVITNPSVGVLHRQKLLKW